MKPTDFPEANKKFGPPDGMGESQVSTIAARVAEIKDGSLDGALVITTAWKLDEEDLERLKAGGYVYLSCIGSLPAHQLTTRL